MKKLATILLLTGSLSMQCAKQLGYWECRIVAAIGGTARCDCEKLNMATGTAEFPSANAHFVHRHFSPDDIYEAPATTFVMAAVTTFAIDARGNDGAVAGITLRIDQPPEICGSYYS